MPIGIGTALLGGAAIAGGVAAYGASQSSKAVGKASDAASESAAQNNALQQQIYAKNTSNISPFAQRGNAAGESINALLGLPTASSAPTAGGQVGAYNPAAGVATTPAASAAPDYAAYVQNNPDLLALFQSGKGQAAGKSIEQFGADHWADHGSTENRAYTPTTGAQQAAQTQQTQAATQATGTPATTPATAQDAFKTYLDSTGHQFRLQTGSNAITSNKLTAGLGKSGATLKALTNYGQNLGTGDFQTYLGNLSNQQGVGLSGVNALAGVGTNYANGVSANNDSAASVAGNAALAGAGQTNALLGQITGAGGNLVGKLGSSYSGAATQNGYLASDQALDGIPF